MKNLLEGLIADLGRQNKKKSELEERAIKTIESEEQKEKAMKKGNGA